MKISMYILERWLKKAGFNVHSSIKTGSAVLQSAHISVGDSRTGVVGVSMKDESAGLVLMENQGDLIFTVNTTLDAVFNQVISAFDYYNAWENSLLRSVFAGFSLQELLDIAQLAFGRPMLIQNSRFEVVGISQSYGAYVHPLWKYYHESQQKVMPFLNWDLPSGFNDVQEWASLQEPAILHSNTFESDFVLANLFLQNVRVGHITMYQHSQPFYQGDLQLMKAFQEIVSFAINANESLLFTTSNRDNYLLEAMGGEKIPGEYTSLNAVYAETGWQDSSGFLFAYFLIDPSVEEKDYDWLWKKLEGELLTDASCLYQNGIGVLLHLPDEDYEAAAASIEEKIQYPEVAAWGLSQPFSGLQNLKQHCTVTKLCALCAQKTGRKGLRMRDAGLRILLNEEQTQPLLAQLVHPEYEILTRYDMENHTHLAATVFWYLVANCNCSDASAWMNTHRNTVNNRMAKVWEIISPHAFDTIESRLLYQITYLRLSDDPVHKLPSRP